ncbi:DIE2/ALG10 family-domain-containing protein [Xylariaceae sp. FL0804]|nr:DIE2/ALG10 family-domain-containing protein [Xylariaceae sp. FL0804]
MSAIAAFRGSSWASDAIRWAFGFAVVRLYATGPQSKTDLSRLAFTSLILLGLSRSWLGLVSVYVPEPYLDEVFHIPQTQVYCEGRYSEWDDKITTPPGLYALTILFNRLMGLDCSVDTLRHFNVEVVHHLAVAALVCRARYEQPKTGPYSLWAVGTGINVALFPVLFFFSGLYYTDPISTCVVLLAYANHLARVGRENTSLGNDLYTLCLGVLALVMRQTNIFWVVIYLGGLEVIHAIRSLQPEPAELPATATWQEQVKFYAWRYSLGDVHDPPLSVAYPIDVLLCIISIGIAAVCNIGLVLRKFAWPHGFTLALFAAFVVWNGGVVLGDKSNHVATLHLAQMLYIWPLFAFFSAPLLLPHVYHLARGALESGTSNSPTQSKGRLKTTSSSPIVKQSPDLKLLSGLAPSHTVQRAVVLAGSLLLALLIIHYNTIVHPFTLADNRHYMFYVFRYSILRAWWVRYALAPAYVACAWLCWAALAAAGQQPAGAGADRAAAAPAESAMVASITTTRATGITTTTSTALLLLLATALSLVTAPLVEPRYFILPWVFWRLLVPAQFTATTTTTNNNTGRHSGGGEQENKPQHQQQQRQQQARKLLPTLGLGLDPRLALETAWFLLLNAATMYVFLTRPFHWRAPDGSLADGGRAQRFMW